MLRRIKTLADGEGVNREPREIDGKDASDVRKVARVDAAMTRFNGPSAEREA